MKRRVYTADSLERLLSSLEKQYGMTSADFYGRVLGGDELPDVPRFHRHIWASMYRDVRRMRGDDFVDHVERTLSFA